MSSQIQLVAPEVREYTLAGPAHKALMLTVKPPETDACAAAVAALESAVDDYLEAVGKVREVDEAKRQYVRKVEAEAEAAVIEGRAPKAIKSPDFDDYRLKANAVVRARLRAVEKARAVLDRQVEADREEQSKRDAARVPELYERVMASLSSLRSGFEQLLKARDASIAQLGGDPNYVVRSLPYHGPVDDSLDAIEAWLSKADRAITEPTIDVRNLEPPVAMRRLMAQGGDMERLHSIELAEGFTITQFTRGYQPPLLGHY